MALFDEDPITLARNHNERAKLIDSWRRDDLKDDQALGDAEAS